MQAKPSAQNRVVCAVQVKMKSREVRTEWIGGEARDEVQCSSVGERYKDQKRSICFSRRQVRRCFAENEARLWASMQKGD
jgi:hypothetical protein